MIKHIVMWKFKKDIREDEKTALKTAMKVELEALVGKVPGLVSLEFIGEPFSTSTHDMALVSELETKKVLTEYSDHPSHIAVADTYVRPFVCDRSCLDYEM